MRRNEPTKNAQRERKKYVEFAPRIAHKSCDGVIGNKAARRWRKRISFLTLFVVYLFISVVKDEVKLPDSTEQWKGKGYYCSLIKEKWAVGKHPRKLTAFEATCRENWKKTFLQMLTSIKWALRNVCARCFNRELQTVFLPLDGKWIFTNTLAVVAVPRARYKFQLLGYGGP